MCKPQISCQLSTNSQLGTPTINWHTILWRKKKTRHPLLKRKTQLKDACYFGDPDEKTDGLRDYIVNQFIVEGLTWDIFFWWNLSTNILLYKYTLGMHVLMKGRGSEPLSRCMHSHKQRPSMSWCTQEK